MNAKLKKQLIESVLRFTVIVVSAAMLLFAAFMVFEKTELDKKKAEIDAVYKSRYSIDLDSLDFLDRTQKERYKKAIVSAAGIYDLKDMKQIVIDEKSVVFDSDLNMYSWSCYCDDSKDTSFLCAFKMSTKQFSCERQYLTEKFTYRDVLAGKTLQVYKTENEKGKKEKQEQKKTKNEKLKESKGQETGEQ